MFFTEVKNSYDASMQDGQQNKNTTTRTSALRKLVLMALVLLLLTGAWYILQLRSKKRAAVASIPATTVEMTGAKNPNFSPQHESGVELKPSVVDRGNGIFSIGAVTFDRNARTITIPAAVNMREGPVEYVLVGRNGKVHEAVFTTNAEASDIHCAALLLGMKPAADLGPENAAATLRRESAVAITVEWDRNGPTEKIFLNETVNLSDPTSKVVSATLPSGAWLYNGSRIEADGVFAATRSASLISIIRDDDSLINNPSSSRDNDEIHTPNAIKLPKKDHPVRIILQLKSAPIP